MWIARNTKRGPVINQEVKVILNQRRKQFILEYAEGYGKVEVKAAAEKAEQSEYEFIMRFGKYLWEVCDTEE